MGEADMVDAKANGITIEDIDALLCQVEIWRNKAKLFALTNPIGFLVVIGQTYADYDAMLHELEKTYRQLRDTLLEKVE
jgi:activator of 2-hydroxyglutaryl-CoA dehydratase